MEGIVRILEKHHNMLVSAGTSLPMRTAIIGQLLTYIANRAVNAVLQTEDLLQTQTAFKLKMGLSKLYEWLGSGHVGLHNALLST